MRKWVYILSAFLVINACKGKRGKEIEYVKPLMLNNVGFDFLKKQEGCRLKAYHDGAAWTIGYGNTFYPDGTRVRRGDVITQKTANELFEIVSNDFAKKTSKKVSSEINQNNLNALTSYSYNRGLGAFSKSRLLKEVNYDPESTEIGGLFVEEWGTNKRYKYSLVRRRMRERELYYL